MKSVLSPQNFFSLEHFAHAELFDGCTFVWEALSKIDAYLRKKELGKIEVDVPQGTFLINPESISIGKGTVLEPGAYIKGPCIIGKNCTIRHGAYIRGAVITGDNCVIGHDTEIKNTIMLDNAHAAHFAYLGDSILGNRVNLGAGTKCANLRLNNSVVEVLVENQKISTGLRKFGAIIGDDSQLGCNSVTNPGSLLGKKVFSYPCTNFGGVIPANSLVKNENKFVVKSLK